MIFNQANAKKSNFLPAALHQLPPGRRLLHRDGGVVVSVPDTFGSGLFLCADGRGAEGLRHSPFVQAAGRDVDFG